MRNNSPLDRKAHILQNALLFSSNLEIGPDGSVVYCTGTKGILLRRFMPSTEIRRRPLDMNLAHDQALATAALHRTYTILCGTVKSIREGLYLDRACVPDGSRLLAAAHILEHEQLHGKKEKLAAIIRLCRARVRRLATSLGVDARQWNRCG